ncbi:hypothetical protein A2313_02855 [Candidatus Roizmanbacteria bacterium RIFOXYB2_FULL_41_10]|uniref:Uncharacterized protein n=1 Tax=Candidatus Roizmanbacteria bacterium RIFOXYA1_FULL_41_12 TaxID=1802082 RepID=A0A1F7KAT7_9BACT|nr:MAG: hypothetical protein A2209_04770 [Candidatus Roizmanbacteria bacterium RIFOXYA1_FULL_41_12]OGK66762.1 MAG: hypothetical protein A2377_02550 [Candidatus Roizmanbacteria bacterium RIFOXYB1_FULL_41_27]OGK67321.1 MAG: hypothetical protein A2262_04020 [Candidatus Roizmanbacteria bacterium RIFOXYA2_FULL_41_8]OGK70674.1 MAG: hypothetical protein A2313_02855 [Candidatus Roizmanbacteria bacterium RIFOXYB2_FULL_41_10]OGK70863.1 MAG: hypothetical protein A2403_02155 [Candidatus Roizmanbacteria bac
MIKKTYLSWLFFLAMTFLSLVYSQAVSAATLEFSPATGSYSTNENFNVEIKVDTSSQDTQSTDAVIEFDTTLLSVENVTYGSFYPTVLHSEQNGKLYISGVVNDAASVKNGAGTLATVSFKGLTAGTATLSFVCTTGRTDDSNVSKNDLDATDLLVCSSLVEGSYTLSGSTVSTPTPTSTTNTGTGTDTGTTTGTEYLDGSGSTIPATGFTDIIALLPKMLMGLIFIAIGLIPLLI